MRINAIIELATKMLFRILSVAVKRNSSNNYNIDAIDGKIFLEMA